MSKDSNNFFGVARGLYVAGNESAIVVFLWG
jgi:hypothetical protein